MANFIHKTNVIEAPSMGIFYSWTNKGVGEDKIASKIDRAFINDLWIDKFSEVKVNYLRYGISDHSLLMFNMNTIVVEDGRPFKFNNIICDHENFEDILQTSSNNVNERFHMMKVWHILKNGK